MILQSGVAAGGVVSIASLIMNTSNILCSFLSHSIFWSSKARAGQRMQYCCRYAFQFLHSMKNWIVENYIGNLW